MEISSIREVFADILPDPLKELEQKKLVQSAIASKGMQGGNAALAAGMGSRSAGYTDGMRRGLSKMFGGKLDTTAERLKKQTQGLDTTTPQGQAQLIGIVRRERGQGAAEQLIEMFRQRNFQDQAANLDERQVKAEEDRVEISATNATANLLNAQSAWTRATSSGASISESINEAIDVLGTGNLDTQSIKRFRAKVNELAQQGVEDPITEAWGMLLDKPDDGWAWQEVEGRTNPDGTPVYQQLPTSGEALQEATSEIRQMESGAQKAIKASADMISLIDDIFGQLDDPAAKTGILGSIIKYVPGTRPYQLNSSIEVALGRMGFNALMEAKESSATGASGFGQLTEKELRLLQSLITSLDVGLTEDELRDRLSLIRDEAQYVSDTAKTEWSIEEWAGVVKPTMPDVQFPSQRAERAVRSTSVSTEFQEMTLEELEAERQRLRGQ